MIPEDDPTDFAAAIEVHDVTKKFRMFNDRKTNLKEVVTVRSRSARSEDFFALKGVSLTIPRGKTFGLIGHNGSGKSTLLKLIAGIHRPTTGTVVHHGRISAMLELGAGFHPELSGRDNVYLNGAILGMTRKQVTAAMDAIIEFSGLEEFIDTPVKVYSSGMYVRLGFAIAVNLDPEILIVDEVIAVGDEEFQRRCFDHLHKLRRRGTTIVLVSHSLDLVQTLCDEVAWLDHGELREVGAAGTVIRSYLAQVNENERDRKPGPSDDEVPQSKREGSHELNVTHIEYVDADGKPITYGIAGQPFAVRIHYEIDKPVDDPVFGIMFYTQNDTYITGEHMRMRDVRMGRVEEGGYVDYGFDELAINPGTYTLSIAVTDWSLTHRFDFWDHAFTLDVRPGIASYYNGILHLDGSWEPSELEAST